MKPSEFNTRLVKIIGNDKFLLTDSIDQEELFEMQDSIAELLTEAFNSGSNIPLVTAWVKNCPVAFKLNFHTS